MKRVKRDVWITSDGQEWLHREDASKHERWLQLRLILEPIWTFATNEGDIADGLLDAVAAGKLQIIIPPTPGTTQR